MQHSTYKLGTFCPLRKVKAMETQSELQQIKLIPSSTQTIGCVLRDAVIKAAEEISLKYGLMSDVELNGGDSDKEVSRSLTDTELGALKLIVNETSESFVGIGIISENGPREFHSIYGSDAYITVNPLGRRKAFIQRKLQDVTTSAALVVNGGVNSAWVADVDAKELFGYSTEDVAVQYIGKYRNDQTLSRARFEEVSKARILHRDPDVKFPPFVQSTLGRFGKRLIDSSSIGKLFARLWKGECGAVLLSPGMETPWDGAPVIGISQRLGFVFLKPVKGRRIWRRYSPKITTEVYRRKHYTLVVHESMLNCFVP